MINKLLTASKGTLVICSLLIGFLAGVVFTVYKSPAITSQLAETGQQASNQPDWPQHISHLKEGIVKEPNNTEMLSQLANAYYETQDYLKSIETYLKLITLLDESTKPYQDLGVVYRRDGQFKKAIDTFEMAIAQDPENINALFNIGVVQYHDLDDEAGAKATWKKVAKVKPDFQLSTGQTLQQLLDKLK